VNKAVQYGANIKATAVYMYNHQITSYERLSEFFKEIYGLELSEETLVNFNKKSYKKLSDFEEKLIATLLEA